MHSKGLTGTCRLAASSYLWVTYFGLIVAYNEDMGLYDIGLYLGENGSDSGGKIIFVFIYFSGYGYRFYIYFSISLFNKKYI